MIAATGFAHEERSLGVHRVPVVDVEPGRLHAQWLDAAGKVAAGHQRHIARAFGGEDRQHARVGVLAADERDPAAIRVRQVGDESPLASDELLARHRSTPAISAMASTIP